MYDGLDGMLYDGIRVLGMTVTENKTCYKLGV